MYARELMTRDVIAVPVSATVADVVELLRRHTISGLPVVDGDRLVGVITGGDVLRAVQQKATKIYHSLLGPTHVVIDERVWREDRHALLALPVVRMMSRGAVTVSPETPVGEIADRMLSQNVRRVFVVEGGRLLGVITRNDIVRWLITGIDRSQGGAFGGAGGS
ncbi:MAG: CBS domain-containing protein [Firmicutes bacterium]|nr:CBS domain-containing protein [Alicyclobacillaceae bacterium]MCL6497720.1 CBS domain-containing protein [Bacillota bacterium]